MLLMGHSETSMAVLSALLGAVLVHAQTSSPSIQNDEPTLMPTLMPTSTTTTAPLGSTSDSSYASPSPSSPPSVSPSSASTDLPFVEIIQSPTSTPMAAATHAVPSSKSPSPSSSSTSDSSNYSSPPSSSSPSLSSASDSTDLPYVEIIQFPTLVPIDKGSAVPSKSPSPGSPRPTSSSSPSLTSINEATDLPYVEIVQLPTPVPIETITTAPPYTEIVQLPTPAPMDTVTAPPYTEIVQIPTPKPIDKVTAPPITTVVLPPGFEIVEVLTTPPPSPPPIFTAVLPPNLQIVEVFAPTIAPVSLGPTATAAETNITTSIPTSSPTTFIQSPTSSTHNSAHGKSNEAASDSTTPFFPSSEDATHSATNITAEAIVLPPAAQNSTTTSGSESALRPTLEPTVSAAWSSSLSIPSSILSSLPAVPGSSLASSPPSSTMSIPSTSSSFESTDLPYLEIIQFPTPAPIDGSESITTDLPYLDIIQFPSPAPKDTAIDSSFGNEPSSTSSSNFPPSNIGMSNPPGSPHDKDATHDKGSTAAINEPAKSPPPPTTSEASSKEIYPNSPTAATTTSSANLPVLDFDLVPFPTPTTALKPTSSEATPQLLPTTPRPTRQPIVFHFLYIYHMGHYHKKKSIENRVPLVDGPDQRDAKYEYAEQLDEDSSRYAEKLDEASMERVTSPHMFVESTAAMHLKKSQNKDVISSRSFVGGTSSHLFGDGADVARSSSSHIFGVSETTQRLRNQMPPNVYAFEDSPSQNGHESLNHRVRMTNESSSKMRNIMVTIVSLGLSWMLL